MKYFFQGISSTARKIATNVRTSQYKRVSKLLLDTRGYRACIADHHCKEIRQEIRALLNNRGLTLMQGLSLLTVSNFRYGIFYIFFFCNNQ